MNNYINKWICVSLLDKINRKTYFYIQTTNKWKYQKDTIYNSTKEKNLPKGDARQYIEKPQILLQEIEKDLYKWKNIPVHSLEDVVKMITVPKLIYEFNVISI